MPISILPQDHDGQELYNAISSFFFESSVAWVGDFTPPNNK
jgi:hypothetical protein